MGNNIYNNNVTKEDDDYIYQNYKTQTVKEIIIEVQGDYFHCNPKLYPKGPKNENQIKYVIRDYYKKCFYLGNDYVLIEIWEDDIRNNFDKVIKQIENAYTAVCG